MMFRILLLLLLIMLGGPAWAQNSPDGAVLIGGAPGSLVTAIGTWTFGAIDTRVPSHGNQIVLNGLHTTRMGYADQMKVAGGGELFAQSLDQWYEFTGTADSVAWAFSAGPPLPPVLGSPVISAFTADKTTVTLAWIVENAQDCTGDNFETGHSRKGFQSFMPPAGTTTFTLTCTNASGSTSKTVTLGK